jgi:beta-lactamase class D
MGTFGLLALLRFGSGLLDFLALLRFASGLLFLALLRIGSGRLDFLALLRIGSGLLDLELDQDVWTFWLYLGLDKDVWTFWLFRRTGSGLSDFLAFRRIVVDRDVKMGISAAHVVVFSHLDTILRRLVAFPGFWSMFTRRFQVTSRELPLRKILLMLRITGLCVFFAITLLSCSINNVTEDDDLRPFFTEENLVGTFGLFNNGNGQFSIYNLKRFKDSAYLPASTFKIVNSLIGIQTGRVKDDSTVIRWDGVVRSRPEWNQDLTMMQAFHHSSVPWFQELARRVGKDTMQKWLDSLSYGALRGRAIIKDIDSFWLDNSIKVTADEQLGLVKRLYFSQLPFYKRTMEIVRLLMLRETTPKYKLSYKTGWGITEAGHNIGWVVGWIEENRHPYFFVLQVESREKDIDMAAARMRLLKRILKHYGFMEGKK